MWRFAAVVGWPVQFQIQKTSLATSIHKWWRTFPTAVSVCEHDIKISNMKEHERPFMGKNRSSCQVWDAVTVSLIDEWEYFKKYNMDFSCWDKSWWDLAIRHTVCQLCKHNFTHFLFFLLFNKWLLYHFCFPSFSDSPLSGFSPPTMDHNSDRNQLLQQLH